MPILRKCMSERIIQEIISSKLYRGQLVTGPVQPCVDGKINTEIASEIIKEILFHLKLEGLYEFQLNMIRHLSEGRSIASFGANGSGKLTAVLLSVLYHTLTTGGNILLVVEEDNFKKVQNELTELLSKSKWEGVVKLQILDDLDSVPVSFEKADVHLCKAETITQYLWNGIHDEDFDYGSLSKIDLISFIDISGYNIYQLMHIRYTLNIIKQHTVNNIQFILTGNSISEPHSFVSDFLGEEYLSEMEYLFPESTQKSSYNLSYWIPPLIRQGHTHEHFHRINLSDEISALLRILAGTDLSNILIWFPSPNISISEIELWRKGFEKENSSVRDKTIHWKSTLIDEDITEFYYDCIISVGVPVGLGNYMDLLGHYIKNDGNVFIFPEENPYSYGIIRDNKEFRYYPNVDISDYIENQIRFIPEDLDTKQKYFLLSLYISSANELNVINKDMVINTWGLENTEEFINDLVNSNLIEVNANDYSIIDRNRYIEFLREYKIVLDDNLYGANTSVLKDLIANSLSPHIGFPGSILYINNRRFRVNYNKDVANIEIAPENSPHVTVPEKKIKFDIATAVNSIVIDNKLELQLNKINEITITTDCYRSYDSNNRFMGKVEISPPVSVDEKDLYCISIDTQYSHALLHLFSVFGTNLFKDIEYLVHLFIKDNNLYICAISEKNNDFLVYLFNNFQSIINKIRDIATNIVVSQPSGEPTYQCIGSAICPYCDNHNLTFKDKLEVIKLINPVSESSRLHSILTFKDSKPDDIGKKYQQKLKPYILDMFEKKLSIPIEQPASLFFDTPELLQKAMGHPVDGYYTRGANEVHANRDVNEMRCIEILAHEFAHNWQFTSDNMHPSLYDSNMPMDGKLVSEGFAQWIAFKFCDFLSLKDNMSSIDLDSTDFGLFIDPHNEEDANLKNEYSVGFQFLTWIEEKFTGFGGVLGFMKTGIAFDPDKKEGFTIDQLLDLYPRKENFKTNN